MSSSSEFLISREDELALKTSEKRFKEMIRDMTVGVVVYAPNMQIQLTNQAMLDMVGLHDRREYYPDSLSGGQRQRVAIARALAAQPKLVLADEPTAALDSDNASLVMDLLKQRTQAAGASVIVVTHDARVFPYADRIVNMVDGRITT